MPMSVFSFSSTALSSTMFINWSKPRSTPVTCRFALSETGPSARTPRHCAFCVKIKEQVVASGLANPTAWPTGAADAHTAELFVHEALQLWRLELGHGGACTSRAGALE